jgi:hypothetical protein
LSVSDTARDTLFRLVDGFIAAPGAVSVAGLPREVLEDLGAVLADSRTSYRDGVMIQLAYGLAEPVLDLTKRQAGARSVAQQLGAFLAERHIRSVKDAYQNIAKNTDVLTRGNVVEFDRLLHWANGASLTDRELALKFTCAAVAATARPVRPMPSLNRSALTFSGVVGLLHGLLATPSGGAFEQFTMAALLDILVANHGEGRARVETKNLNASDRSSRAAGDVQVVVGNRVIDAFEVTANDWRTKVTGASKVIRDNDLSRLHIVATRVEGDRAAVAAALQELAEDVSVLDARQVVEVLAAVLTRPQRADALARLYEYLDRYQPDTDRVNLLVERLEAADLVERTGD